MIEVLQKYRFVRPFLGGLLFGVFLMGLVVTLDRMGVIDLKTPFVYGASDIIRPNRDATTNNGTPTTCGAASSSSCIDEVVTTADTPVTIDDYLSQGSNDVDFFQMSDNIGDAATVTAITLHVYHRQGNANMQLDVALFDNGEVTQIATTAVFTTRTNAGWDSHSWGGLQLTQQQLDTLHIRLQCTRPAGGKGDVCDTFAVYADVEYDQEINVTVSTESGDSQRDLTVGTSSAYVGGTFVIQEQTASRNITSISIAEAGSVDAQNDLSNIELWYDLDTTPGDGYNCSDEVFDGDEVQYGLTDTDGFSAANGTSTFTQTVPISTGQSLCVYVVLDVDDTASYGDTLEIVLNNPSVNVGASGVIEPNTQLALPQTTTLLDEDVQVTNFHWRDDNGDEGDTGSGADSATGGNKNTDIEAGAKGTNYRLRYMVYNQGNATTTAKKYRIEYGEKLTLCSAISDGSWVDVGAAGGDWDMVGTGSGLTEGSNTTNITTTAKGAITPDPSGDFLSVNAAQKESFSTTSDLVLTDGQFVEVEYALIADAGVSDGTTYCFRLTDDGATSTVNNALYPQFTVAADITVSANGSQASTISIPTNNVDNGGQFAITDGTPSSVHTIQEITITASGTVDLQNDIDNIELWYEYDNTGPTYDCSGLTRDGGESLFAAADTDGFSINGTSTFLASGLVEASTTQAVCLYVEYDVLASSTNGELIEIRIADPSTQVVVDTGTVAPVGLLDLTGVTTLIAPYVQQGSYHWRNNDGDEAGATSATAGSENTVYDEIPQNTTLRLRFDVSNTGGEASGNYQYRLEWAQKLGSCAAATSWVDVDVPGDEFATSSSQLVNGANTNDISLSLGGVSNLAGSLLTANSGQVASTSQSGNINLASDEYAELEYNLEATASTSEGASYCFRLTNAGVKLDNYVAYPELNIKLGTDFSVTHNVATILNGNTSVTIFEGSDYNLQLGSTSRAFVRITNVANTGAGPASTGNHSSDDVTAYISNPGNITTSITFTRAGVTDDTRIAWEVIEYVGDPGGENEIIVRGQGVASYAAAGLTVNTPTITNIGDDTRVLPWITGQGNTDTGRFDYHTGLSTSAWNAGTDTATFTRGDQNNNVVNVSYAIVEFAGSNLNIQRVSHTYDTVGAPESVSISPVGSTNRTFIHAQKRMGAGQDTHADFGHEIYFTGMGTMQFAIDGGAGTASLHTSVAWLVESTQDQGNTMKVWRDTDTIPSSGTAPVVLNPDIIGGGQELSDLSIASLFIHARADGTARTFQEPIISARLLTSSSTQYEIWVGDPTDNVTYRTEIVEWPTASPKFIQNDFLLYVDNDLLDPTDPWPAGVSDLIENAEMTATDGPMATGDNIRIRMNLTVTAATQPSGVDSFRLEYAERPGESCTAMAESEWRQIGDVSSTSALWRAFDAAPIDGTALSTDPPTAGDLNLTLSDVAGTYEEENNTAVNPFIALVGEDVEYDWNIQNNGAKDKTNYCFRMTYADGALLDGYGAYPVIRTVGYGPEVSLWQWFDDENNETPVDDLAATNTTPIDITNDNIIKLRVSVAEKSGATGEDVKFKLQFSEYPSFSDGGFDVVEIAQCQGDSLWCYADGAGVNNATITTAVLDDTLGTCAAQVGVGCGSHNESTTTEDISVDHQAYQTTEYEFTIQNAGARANAVYYFRLYNLTDEEVVPASTTDPSLQVEGPGLVFTVSGVDAGVDTNEGAITDVATTPTSIGFGSVPIDMEYEAAQQISVDTNATDGYRLFMYADNQLLNNSGDSIPPVTGTNGSPTSWALGCPNGVVGCFGYHVGDDTLSGATAARFAPPNTYAALSSNLEEVMFSSVPANESSVIVYKLQVSSQQLAGDYETTITYVVVPRF